MSRRHAAPFLRDVFARFRRNEISTAEAAAELQLSRSRLYALYAGYLRACAERRQHRWQPGASGGDHAPAWPPQVVATLRKLLGASPPLSYSGAASELLRRHAFSLDRASVRRWALHNGCAPDTRHKKAPKPVRRWQTQQIGQLWQYDASPHRWFPDQPARFHLLQALDDHSRLLPLARLYPAETLLAHFDYLPAAFRARGLPLALYVDYHSFFFTSQPDALTQLGWALRFYEISLRYAPTPQAKGKIERLHDYWQKRLPPLLAAEHIATLPAANELLVSLVEHRNASERHRELRSTPLAAWRLALREKRSALRPAPKCPWWPYVWSVRSNARVASDGTIAIGSQRFAIDRPPGSSVVRCLHTNGDHSVLLHPPAHRQRPQLLLHLPHPS